MTLSDFRPAPEAVAALIPSEAEALSDAALLAVHQPVQLLRRSLTDPVAAPTPTDERAVLDALLSPHLPEGYAVVPVVGPAGSGKTHLVRWLGLHAGAGRHVVRIPKGADPRRVLDVPAREQPDEIAVEEDLLAKFRTALRRRTARARAECDAAMKLHGAVDPELRAVAETHGDGLVVLLEGQTKDALLQGVIRELVRQIVTGGGEAREFAPADFEFSTIQSNKIPDLKLQRYVQKLKTDQPPGQRETAARLMNEARAEAVAQLPAPREERLADVFHRLREELLKEGKELVLVVEDFSSIADQRELLGVITTPGVRDGEVVLCPVRTALAAPEGFLAGHDAIASRIGHEFVIGEQPVDEEAAADMVGAYLNAARVGAAGAGELPDADRAAPDAAGRSRHGHSLYPFDREAVRRLAGEPPFNPRRLIKNLQHALLSPEVIEPTPEAAPPKPAEPPVPEPVAPPVEAVAPPVSDFRAAVAKLLAACRETASAAWVGWVRSITPHVDDTALERFEREEDRPLVDEVRRLRERLRQAEREPGESDADFAAVEATATELRMALGRLQSAVSAGDR